MISQVVRSFKTFLRIWKMDKRLAFEISQSRLEKYLKFSVYLVDPLRRRTFNFEQRNTQKPSEDLVAYGNYFLIGNNIPDQPVVFSLGIGEDTRFDEAILDYHNASLFLFDPTPRSASYVKTRRKLMKAEFEQIAVSDHDGELVVYIDDLQPDLDTTTSVTSVKRVGYNDSFTVPCKSIPSILQERKIDHIDILKIDIEGGGLVVLKDVLNAKIFPSQILGEFERPSTKEELDIFLNEIQSVFNVLKLNNYKIYRTRSEDKGFQIEITASKI